MASATNMLNSMPQVVEGKEKLARTQGLEEALKTLTAKLHGNGFPAEKLAIIEQIGKLLGPPK